MVINLKDEVSLIICLSIFCWALAIYTISYFYYLVKEKQRLKRMEMTLEENVHYLVKSVDHLTVEVKTIKRGLYGDPENKVPGLIARQDQDEKRLDKLEEMHKQDSFKRNWFIGLLVGAGTVVNGIVHFFKDIFK